MDGEKRRATSRSLKAKEKEGKEDQTAALVQAFFFSGLDLLRLLHTYMLLIQLDFYMFLGCIPTLTQILKAPWPGRPQKRQVLLLQSILTIHLPSPLRSTTCPCPGNNREGGTRNPVGTWMCQSSSEFGW